jgi:hypothetical protein
MSKRWNLAELVVLTSRILNFNSRQANQDFSPQDIKDTINEVYCDEIEEMIQHGDSRWFIVSEPQTWPSGSLTFSLPETLQGRWIRSIVDVTFGVPGIAYWFDQWIDGAMFSWSDAQTIRWPDTVGPSEDRLLTFSYVADAEEMTNDQEVPLLLPAKFRHLLGWSAAIKLAAIGDREVATQWIRERDAIRERAMKFFSLRGPLLTGPPGILNTNRGLPGTYP